MNIVAMRYVRLSVTLCLLRFVHTQKPQQACKAASKNENFTIVTLDGISQHKSAYNVSSNILTFSGAPDTGVAIDVSTFYGGSQGSGQYQTRNFTGDGTTVNYTVSARTTANSAYAQANTATTLAQAAYNQANTGGAGATESLNVVFDNSTATQYKIVALNANAETGLATSLEIGQIDRVLGVLDDAGETVTFGAITNPSWTWTPEQSLYLGSNGTIVTTSTIDGAAFSLKIGYAISGIKAFIKIGTPVVL